MEKNRKKTKIIVLISLLVIICISLDYNRINVYQKEMQEIEKLETSVEIAREYMSRKYNGQWRYIDDVVCGKLYHIDHPDLYQIYTSIIPGTDMEYFMSLERRYNLDEKYDWGGNLIYDAGVDPVIDGEIEKVIEIDENRRKHVTIRIAINGSSNIAVFIEYYNLDLDGNKELYFYDITTENGEYVVDGAYVIEGGERKKSEEPKDIEELTEMTVEEIVETAETYRQGFDKIMYEMKERQSQLSEEKLYFSLLLINVAGAGIIAWLLIRNRKKEAGANEYGK